MTLSRGYYFAYIIFNYNTPTKDNKTAATPHTNRTRIEEPNVPVKSERNKFFMEAPSCVLTIKIPTIESKIPKAATIIGAITNFIEQPGNTAPRAAVARIEPQYDS